MPRRKGIVSPYCFFVTEQLPELQRRRLPVTCVIDAIPYCSQAWATCNLALPVPACPTTKMPCVTFPDASVMSWKNDQAVLVDIFYFLNIYSHGKLPSHCEQRFLPCEIGCVKYSLQDGIMADFHHFIEPEVPPRGFRYHCQAASDATHKIPISGFHLPRTCYAVVLWELLEFVHPARGVWPRVYCRSNDRFRISWCLNRMASITGIESHLELLDVEDLVIELHQKKYQKEPSKTWVCRELDAFLWDFSSNTRCKWHEENDILCCALASCKKIVYCISKSLASAYGVSLTAAHLPLQDLDNGESTNTKMVILDAGRFQNMKAEGPACDRHFASPSWHQEFVPSHCDSPCGVKTCSLYGTSIMRGRGITQLLKSASNLTKHFSN
ncbi:protein maelstrom homolog isoform X2 [Neopsephotus bourkii]|uniref:protein maelstrom homolog isoform X2 n=1 Tax=Neopsephotus bourkii TaxID=309878 RepID=UPI002AA4F6D7|nr:protein maelstrom homolog isoform X2 [Neopsephotus bourkii]